MKSFRLTIAALATAAIATTAGNLPSAFAQMDTMPEPAPTELPADSPIEVQTDASATFGMNETDQTPFIMVAQPTSRLGGKQRYGLMIIEQKREEPLCYSTTGSSPTQVNILLLNFDFSGICGKSTDTNGYIIRAGGEDLKFDPVVENEDGVLVLYAKPRRSAGSNAEKFIIGQTDGIAANGFTQIFMKPGWRLARQTFNDSVTGRTYIANDMTVAQLSGQDVAIEPGGGDQSGGGVVTPPPSGAASFPDVTGDTYANEINRAVQLGFISGFAEDNTFRPRASLTREQLVSIAVEGLGVAPASAVGANPFPDVPASRWSAAKIKTAQDLGIVSGYGDGSFRPTAEVTRAELIAIMRRAAEYKNGTTTLVANQPVDTFSDTNGHWANDVISNLSGFCGVASPLNETGTAFYPNQAAQRNYAAAAMVRLLDCTQTTAAQ
ncbi:MAG: DUF3747 domain-containing protein [Cyanobacteria bacterium J06598_1]